MPDGGGKANSKLMQLALSPKLESVKYPFIAITSSFTLRVIIPVRVSSMGQIERFNHLLRMTIIWNHIVENICIRNIW